MLPVLVAEPEALPIDLGASRQREVGHADRRLRGARERERDGVGAGFISYVVLLQAITGKARRGLRLEPIKA